MTAGLSEYGDDWYLYTQPVRSLSVFRRYISCKCFQKGPFSECFVYSVRTVLTGTNWALPHSIQQGGFVPWAGPRRARAQAQSGTGQHGTNGTNRTYGVLKLSSICRFTLARQRSRHKTLHKNFCIFLANRAFVRRFIWIVGVCSYLGKKYLWNALYHHKLWAIVQLICIPQKSGSKLTSCRKKKKKKTRAKEFNQSSA